MSAPRFPAVALHRGHYESYFLRAADPASGRSATGSAIPFFKRPGGPVDRRAVVHAVRRRRARAARRRAVVARPARRRLARARAEPHRARRRPRPRRGAGTQRGLGAHLRPRVRAAAPPPPPQLYDAPLPRTKTGEPGCPHTTISGWVEADGGALGARRLARDARPQLGRPSTPSAGSGCTASASTARRTRGSTSRSAASGSAASTTPWSRTAPLHLDGGRDPPRRSGPACARGRAAGRWDDRGQRRARPSARSAAHVSLGLLRPLRRRARKCPTARSLPLG